MLKLLLLILIVFGLFLFENSNETVPPQLVEVVDHSSDLLLKNSIESLSVSDLPDSVQAVPELIAALNQTRFSFSKEVVGTRSLYREEDGQALLMVSSLGAIEGTIKNAEGTFSVTTESGITRVAKAGGHKPCGNNLMPNIGSFIEVGEPSNYAVAKNAVVDIVVGYTDDYLAHKGSVDAVETKIALDIATANEVIKNSFVSATIKMASSRLVDYEEGTFAVMLDELQNPTGELSELHLERDNLGADLVSLYVNGSVDSSACGIGSLPTNFGQFGSTASYSIIKADCPTYTLIHELGHNFGAQHNLEDATGPRLFSYAVGNRSSNYHTVMSYPLTGTSELAPAFSSAIVKYKEFNTGEFGVKENARVLIQTIPIVASYSKKQTYDLTGTITLGASPVPGVLAVDPALPAASTNSQGAFGYSGFQEATRIDLSFFKQGYVFTPATFSHEFTDSSVQLEVQASCASGYIEFNGACTNAYGPMSGYVFYEQQPVPDIVVSDPFLGQTKTDITGRFEFREVPEGLNFELTFSKVNFIFTPAGLSSVYGFDDIILPTISSTCKEGTEFIDGICAEVIIDIDSDGDGISDAEELKYGTNPSRRDTDGDGIDDGTELAQGTSPLDRGSFFESLSTTICSEWNGFFLGQMANIVEHVNMSSEVIYVFTELYNALGEITDTVGFAIPPGAQFDLLVHDMNGREQEAYGKVCSRHSGQPGDLDGRMVYYKAQKDGYEFAFAMPFMNGRKGSQFVTLNTVQPSLRAEDASDIVANWIQITNLETVPESGNLVFYREDGSELGRFFLQLRAGGRFDVSGHQFGSTFGSVGWFPLNEEASFITRNVRYLTDNPFGLPTYDSAFQVEARSGTGQKLVVPYGSSTVVEVANTSSQTQSLDYFYHRSDGGLLVGNTITLPPHASTRLAPSDVNPSGGVVILQPSSPESIIATAFTYGYALDGAVKYFYGVDASQPFGDTLRGSYNTFLMQKCSLNMSNPGSVQTVAAISLTRPDGTLVSNMGSYSVPARGLLTLDICSQDVPDTYGVININVNTPNTLTAYLLREGFNDQYQFPTPVRE